MLHILSSSLHHEEVKLPFEVPQSWAEQHQAVAVLTGGSEGLFLQLVNDNAISLSQPIYLIVSQQSNSLAAAMEILTWINQHGGNGEILTEIPEQTAAKTNVIDRIGMIGASSDWLIASRYDRDALHSNLGIEIVDIDISEITKIGKVDGGMQGATIIYNRIKELIEEHHLSAITLRCFDLLTTVCNTGCIALSKLNDEGIPASCEGDIPTLVTMIVCKRLTGCPGFQANPARIDPRSGKMLFAHCTIPLSMTTEHSYDTHFESGIGVAFHGELPTGDYTLVKISGNLNRIFAEDIQLTSNQYEPNLCRTQVWIEASPSAAKQLLTNPIANHHVIIPGHWAESLRKTILG